MKITEIILEDQATDLDELGPASGIGSLATSALGALGSKTAQAKSDVNSRTNELFNSFKTWAIRSGVDLKMTSVSDINQWLKTQGLPSTNKIGANTVVYNFSDNRQALQVFKVLAQTAFRQAGPGGSPLGAQYGIQAPAKKRGGNTAAVSSVVSQIGKMNAADKAALAGQLRTLLGTT
jgi:hypothetical protein